MTTEKAKEYVRTIYDIVGAAFAVRKELKFGLAEAIYEEALCIELKLRGIDAKEQMDLPVYYKGIQLKKHYRMDIVVMDDIIIELKAAGEIIPEHRAQLFNYLRLTNKPIGILINFGDNVEVEKYLYTSETNEIDIFRYK